MRKLILSVLTATVMLGAGSAAHATTYFYDLDAESVIKTCDLYYDPVCLAESTRFKPLGG